MSWDATLTTATGETLGDWNYTHNTNAMANAAMVAAEGLRPGLMKSHESWFRQLDGMSGPDGARLLHEIVSRLEADPVRFDRMNPPNGWGSRESLVEVLSEMRNAVPEQLATWTVCG